MSKLVSSICCTYIFFNFSCEDSEMTHVKVHQKINSPLEALAALKYGNARFLDNHLINTDYHNQIDATAGGQHPHSFILSCVDSRIPPEIIFDQGIGNVFVARVAGNIESAHIMGSMEYAVAVKKIKLIVVMGHGNCGAINGALDDVQLDNLSSIMDDIRPSLRQDNQVRENDVTITTLNNIRKNH
jgi:carbonic anhydrase